MHILPEKCSEDGWAYCWTPTPTGQRNGSSGRSIGEVARLKPPEMASVRGKLMRGEKSSVNAAYLGRDDGWWCGLQTASRIAGRMAASEEANDEDGRWVGERVVWVR